LITLTALIYLTERKPCQIDYFGHSYLLRAFYLATASLFLLCVLLSGGKLCSAQRLIVNKKKRYPLINNKIIINF